MIYGPVKFMLHTATFSIILYSTDKRTKAQKHKKQKDKKQKDKRTEGQTDKKIIKDKRTTK